MKRSTKGESILNDPNMAETMRLRLAKMSVRTESGCIVWIGCTAGRGYGTVSSSNAAIYTHRAAWIINRGQIPAGISVLHICDNPPCINPDHLWLGTAQQNSLDASKKGRLVGNRTCGEAKPIAKLTVANVIDIRHRFANGESIHRIRTHYPFVTWENIKAIVVGRTWQHVLGAEKSATRG